MPPARTSTHRRGSFSGYQATTGTRQERAVRDLLPGHPLARHIDDFLADLANANRPRNTIRAYRGDLTGFAAHHDDDNAGLTEAPVRAFPGKIAGQARTWSHITNSPTPCDPTAVWRGSLHLARSCRHGPGGNRQIPPDDRSVIPSSTGLWSRILTSSCSGASSSRRPLKV
jgi:hypothetical protein